MLKILKEVVIQVHNELKNLRWRPAQIVTKQDWQDRFRNIKFGKKGFEDTEKVENSAMSVPYYDENLYLLNMKNDLEAKVVFYLHDSIFTTYKRWKNYCTIIAVLLFAHH